MYIPVPSRMQVTLEREKRKPTLSKLDNLKSKRQRLLSEAGKILTESGITAEYRAKVAEADATQEDITLIETFPAEVRAKLDAPVVAPATVAAPPVQAPAILTETSATERKRVNAAYRHFFRHGARPHAPEQRDILATSDAAGGGLIARAFSTVYSEAAKYAGPIFNLANRKDATNAEPTKFIVSDDTARSFSLMTEGTTSAVSVASQPTLFSDVDGVDTLASSVVYSIQELDDAFDLESFLKRNGATAVARAWETALTLGTTNDGTNTALPNNPGLLTSITAGFTQNALADGIGYVPLTLTATSIDHAYYAAPDSGFMASPSVFQWLIAQVDGEGRPFYKFDDEGRLLIANKPLFVNAAMPAYNAASKPVVLFGQYSKALNVLNAGGLKIKVVTESQANNIFTKEMILYTRIGSSIGLSSACKTFVTAAS